MGHEPGLQIRPQMGAGGQRDSLALGTDNWEDRGITHGACPRA